MKLLDARGLRLLVHTDLHLCPSRPAEIAAFASALPEQARSAGGVAVLGDLFDAYLGPEQWREPEFAPLGAALARLRDAGKRLILLRGNRDVLLEDQDGAALGLEIADRLLAGAGESAGGLLLLSHGDEFCRRDKPYQRLRWTLRRPLLRRLIRALPYRLRRRLAARLRRASRRAVARKPLNTLALVEEAVAQELRRLGAGRAVIGHLHVAERRILGGGLELHILPAWSPGAPGVVLGADSAGLDS